MPNPVVFVHGYSDKGASWAAWREILRRRLGLDNADMRTCTYVSLNNEVTIKDLAEAFDRALATQGGLDPDAPFDADGPFHRHAGRALMAGRRSVARQAPEAVDRAGARDFRLAARQKRAQLARLGFQGQQTARPRFSGGRRPHSGRPRTRQLVYLAARRGRRVDRAAALRRRSRDALCVCVLRHRHVFGSAQARRQARHGRDRAARRLWPQHPRDRARHDREGDGRTPYGH